MLENLFGVHERSMLLRGERSAILASNLANADTPNYKARDFDFSAALVAARASTDLPLARTSRWLVGRASFSVSSGDLKYRLP